MKAVIQIALGEEPDLSPNHAGKPAGVRFIFTKEDIENLNRMKKDPEIDIVCEEVHPITNDAVSDSSTRFGCYVFTSDSREKLMNYLPENCL